MSDTAELSRLRSSVSFHGAAAGAAVVASLVVVGILGWRWLESAFSTLDITESKVEWRTLNEYLETRSIPAGSWASVEVQEGACSRWAATVRIFRVDQAALPGKDPDVIDTASFVVFEDSGDPIPEERPGMTAEQVEAELCEAAAR
jgi:hypothetical protein